MGKRTTQSRKKRIEDIKKSLDGVGEGLFKPQIEVKLTPWKGTWELLEMMIEGQEEMISLLTEIRDLLKGVGLSIHEMHTDFDSRPFTGESRRMIIFAMKG